MIPAQRSLLWILFFSIFPLPSRAEEPKISQAEFDAYVKKNTADLAPVFTELRKDFPLRAGMTVDEVKNVVIVYNKKWNDNPDRYSVPDTSSYVFFDSSDTNGKSLTYFVSGRYDLVVHLAVENSRIKNIYLARGNMNAIMYPAILYDGTGTHAGWPVIVID